MAWTGDTKTITVTGNKTEVRVKREESWQGTAPSPASKTKWQSSGNTLQSTITIYLAYSAWSCSCNRSNSWHTDHNCTTNRYQLAKHHTLCNLSISPIATYSSVSQTFVLVQLFWLQKITMHPHILAHIIVRLDDMYPKLKIYTSEMTLITNMYQHHTLQCSAWFDLN
jgi:hypothetical protein